MALANEAAVLIRSFESTNGLLLGSSVASSGVSARVSVQLLAGSTVAVTAAAASLAAYLQSAAFVAAMAAVAPGYAANGTSLAVPSPSLACGAASAGGLYEVYLNGVYTSTGCLTPANLQAALATGAAGNTKLEVFLSAGSTLALPPNTPLTFTPGLRTSVACSQYGGPAAPRCVISGGHASEILSVPAAANVLLTGLALLNGNATGFGGAMLVGVNATVSAVGCLFQARTRWCLRRSFGLGLHAARAAGALIEAQGHFCTSRARAARSYAASPPVCRRASPLTPSLAFSRTTTRRRRAGP